MRKGLILLLLLPAFLKSQKSKIIHPAILGARFNLLDFGSKRVFGSINVMSPGLGFSFIKGLGNQVDWSVSADASLSDSATDLKLPDKKLLLQAEGGVRIRMFTTGARLQPFLAGAVGISIFDNNYSAYLPVGMGLQVTLFPDTYILINVQYRVTAPKNINYHYFYSIGFSGAITPARKKTSSLTKKTILPPGFPVATDRDQDGIVDSLDICPDIPGMALFAGCPDRDNDGIPDKEDSCPEVFGVIKYKGCPIPDLDKDGINDEADSCVTIFGTIKYHGCPAPDRDNDGVPDDEDKCPELAGLLANNGCPEIKKELESSINKAAKNILFATGSYRLLKVSNHSLDEVVNILKVDTLLNVSIEGHTDSVGDADKNQLLSEQRARAVMNYLIKVGIRSSRLVFSGYGEGKPVSDNNTFAGRRTNRRVEMIVSY